MRIRPEWQGEDSRCGGLVRAHGQLGFGRSTAGGGGKERSGTESGGKLGGSAL